MDYKKGAAGMAILLVALAAFTAYIGLNPVKVTSTVTVTNTSTSSAGAPEVGSVTVAESVDTYTGNGPIKIGIQQGFFSNLGLTVNIVITTNNVRAVEGGQAQFAVTSPPFAADAGGADLIAVGQTLGSFPGAIIAQPSINSLADLNGKTFGCTSTGSLTCLMAYLLIKSQNWTYSPDLIKPIGSQNGLITAFENGDVQAIVFNWGTGLQLKEQGKAKILGDIRTFVPDWYSSSIVVARSFAKDSPKTVRYFLAALYEANLWVAQHPNETIQWIQGYYKVSDYQARVLYNTTQFSLLVTMEPQLMEYMYNVYVGEANLQQFAWQAIYTNEYLPKMSYSPS